MKDVDMRIVVGITALLSLAAWIILWGLGPSYQAELVGRAGWIVLVAAAWWLTGRVLAGK
jgi:hypothetical protein